MSYAQYLRELLRPLGVYDLTAPINGGELDGAGVGLDGAEARLDEILRETFLTTAEGCGLERIAVLLARRPVTEEPRVLGDALAALLRIGGDSFTLAAINDTLSGCGVCARVMEEQVGTVTVHFPDVGGIPAGFDELKQIIEDILPAHLEVKYHFWYMIWEELERKLPTWQAIESQGLTWVELEAYVG